MDSSANTCIEYQSGLEQQAELLFPYPFKACVFVKKKINWKRSEWINERLASSDNKPNQS